MQFLQIGDIANLIVYWLPTGIALAGGAILAAYFYRKSKKVKQPAYVVTTRNLIGKASTKLSDIQVTFKTKPVEVVSVSKVAIWNDGTDTIRGTDIASADPLRIVIGDGALLDLAIVLSSAPSQFKVGARADGTLEVGFDYLDKEQGGVVQLVHTGLSSDKILLVGSVKGGSPIIRREVGRNKWLSRAEELLTSGGGLVAGLMITLILTNQTVTNEIFAASVVGVLVFAVIIVRYLAKKIGTVPKTFESAMELRL